MIVCIDKLKIFTPNYKIELEYQILEKIKVTPYYGYSSLRFKGATFRGDFKDKSTMTFITKDGEEYEWGYTLSYQKGMEIKRLIEERIEEMNNKEKNSFEG